MWQQMGQSIRLNWLTLADKLATGGKHQTTPGQTSVLGQPVPTESKHSPASSWQIHWHKNSLFLASQCICQSTFNARFFSRGREGLVVSNHTLSIEEAVKSNGFSTTPEVKNLLVKPVPVLSSNLMILMTWQCKLPKGESFLCPPVHWLAGNAHRMQSRKHFFFFFHCFLAVY